MPTPDERRASWVEPGLAKRVEDGRVTQVAIDLNRVQTYQGNGMTLLGFPVVSTADTPVMSPHLILTPAAIRRLYRLVGPEEPKAEPWCDACGDRGGSGPLDPCEACGKYGPLE